MKNAPVLLGFSLLGNAALLGAIIFSSPDHSDSDPPTAGVGVPAAVETGRGGSAATTNVRASEQEAVVLAGNADVVAMLRSGSPEKVRDVLRAAGMSPELVRAIVSMLIQERYRDRLDALRPGGQVDPQRYWRRESAPMDLEKMIERSRLFREVSREVDAMMGTGEQSGRKDDRLAFLDEAKRQMTESVERDYSEMRNEMSMAMRGFPLKSDEAMVRMLDEERRRDMAELLNPEELAAWELRTSATAAQVQGRYGWVLDSEEEYRAVYALQKAFDERYNPVMSMGVYTGHRTMDRSEMEARRAAEQELQAQIAAIIGPERSAQLARERDPDYRTMQAATARLGLPATATNQVFEIRARVIAASQQIAADPSLGREQAKAAFAALANGLRGELSGVLGAEGGEAFVQRASWVRMLEQGQAIAERPEGGVGPAVQSRLRSGP